METDQRSRVVARRIESGNTANCSTCELPVKFAAKKRANQIIANVYVDGKCNRVEHYHADCYKEAGQPYGKPAKQELK